MAADAKTPQQALAELQEALKQADAELQEALKQADAELEAVEGDLEAVEGKLETAVAGKLAATNEQDKADWQVLVDSTMETRTSLEDDVADLKKKIRSLEEKEARLRAQVHGLSMEFQVQVERVDNDQNREALTSYFQRSRDEGIRKIGDCLFRIVTWAMTAKFVFAACVAPSGSGKTLKSLAVRGGLRLVLQANAGQYINNAAVGVGCALLRLINEDMNKFLLHAEKPTFAWFGNDPNRRFRSVAFLCYLLEQTKDYHAKPEHFFPGTAATAASDPAPPTTAGDAAFFLLQLNGIVTLEDAPISALANMVEGRVLILDEVPHHHDVHFKCVQFMRNLCRRAHLPVLLMGTESSATNLEEAAAGSGAGLDIWTYLIPHLGGFAPNAEQRQIIASVAAIPSLCDEKSWIDTNPMLAEKALEIIGRAPANMKTDPRSEGELLEQIRRGLISYLHVRKPSIYSGRGLNAQFALHTDALYEPDCTSTFVSDHLAKLVFAEDEKDFQHDPDEKNLYCIPLNICGSQRSKNAELVILKAGKGLAMRALDDVGSSFNSMDKLLLLACGGGWNESNKFIHCFHGDQNEPINTMAAFLLTRKDLFPRGIQSGTSAKSRDGALLECVYSVAAIVASHRQRLDGPRMDPDTYIAQLYAEMTLGNHNWDFSWHDDNTKPSRFVIKMPSENEKNSARAEVDPTTRAGIMYSVNSQFVQGKAFSNVFGQAKRLENKQEADLALVQGWDDYNMGDSGCFAVIEMKNCEGNLPLKKVKNCIDKANKHSAQYAFVVSTNFQSKYNAQPCAFFVEESKKTSGKLVLRNAPASSQPQDKKRKGARAKLQQSDKGTVDMRDDDAEEGRAIGKKRDKPEEDV